MYLVFYSIIIYKQFHLVQLFLMVDERERERVRERESETTSVKKGTQTQNFSGGKIFFANFANFYQIHESKYTRNILCDQIREI